MASLGIPTADITVTTVIEKQPTLSYPRLALDPSSKRTLAVWNQVNDPEGKRGVYTAALGCTWKQQPITRTCSSRPERVFVTRLAAARRHTSAAWCQP